MDSLIWNNKEIHYNDYYKQCLKHKNKITDINQIWIDINIDDVKVGDDVFIEYHQNSLKNFFDLTPECGKVVEIELLNCPVNNNKYKNILIINHLNQKISIDKEWSGLYSRCYDITIYKKINS
jgi:hypothetical protein